MRNLHLILLQEDGVEARRLFRLWEKLWLRASKYKNHRIFTLRCLHNDLIPTSIKVGEIRFNKVKQRQLNKFNLLINRKEGNITRSNNTNSNTNNLTIQSGSHINQSNQINQTTSQVNPPPTLEGSIPSQAGNSVNSQAQAPRNPTLPIALLPPGEGSSSPLATGHLLPKGTGLPQANSQVIGSHPIPAIAQLPGEGSNSPPVTGHLLPEGTGLPQANSQVIGSHPTLAIAHLPPREGSNSPPVTVHPSSEGSQASGGLPSLASALLPPGEGSNFLLGAVHLPLEDDSSSQAIVLLPSGEENNSSQATSPTQGEK